MQEQGQEQEALGSIAKQIESYRQSQSVVKSEIPPNY